MRFIKNSINIFTLIVISLFVLFILNPSFIINFNSNPLGDYGDVRGFIYDAWVYSQQKNISIQEFIQPVSRSLFIFFNKYLNLSASYNLVILNYFLFSTIITYYVFLKITKKKFPSIFGSILFTYSPNIISHTIAGHIVFTFTGFISFSFYLFFLYFYRKDNQKVYLISIVIFLQFLISLYYSFFIILLFFILLMICNISIKRKKINFVKFKKIIFPILITVFPVGIYSLAIILIDSSIPIDGSRSFGELNIFSNRIYEFFIPSVNNYFYGEYVSKFSKDFLHGSNFFEQTYYLPLGLYLLFFYTLYLVHQKKIILKNNTILIKSSLFFLIIFLFSFPGYISVYDTKLYNINFFTWFFFPFIRAYGRLSIFINFIIIAISIFGLSYLLKLKNQNCVKKITLLSLLVIFVLFELSFKPHQLKYENNDYYFNEIYSYIEPNSDVVFLPLFKSEHAYNYNYLYLSINRSLNIVNPKFDQSNLLIKGTNYCDFIKKLLEDYIINNNINYIIIDKYAIEDGVIPRQLKYYFTEYESNLNYTCNYYNFFNNKVLIENNRFILLKNH